MLSLADALIRKRLMQGALFVLIGMAAAGVLPNQLRWRERNPQRATLERIIDIRSGSGALRVRQYVETINLMGSKWWRGVGMGQWRTMMQEGGMGGLAVNRVPHSDYLRVWADCGALGVFLVLVLFAAAFVFAWKAQNTLFLCFSVGLFVTSIVDVPLYRLESVTLCAAWVACALCDSKRSRFRA